MQVSAGTIRAVLERVELGYDWSPADEQREYKLASLFNPIDSGFYFFSGASDLPSTITNSLVMVKADYAGSADRGNDFVYLNSTDPQQAYYKVLGELFGRKSSGEKAASAIIHPEAKLGSNVQVDDFCIIEKDCVIGDNVIIGSHSKIHAGTTIGENSIIETMSVIGTQGVAWTWNDDQSLKIVQPQLGGVYIGTNCFLGANAILVRGSLNENTSIGDNTLIAPGCRIGHGTQIGASVHFANNVVTGGNSKIGDFSFIGSAAVFRPKVQIHEKTVVGAGSVVVKNTTAGGMTLMGVPAKEMQTKENPSGMPAPKR